MSIAKVRFIAIVIALGLAVVMQKTCEEPQVVEQVRKPRGKPLLDYKGKMREIDISLIHREDNDDSLRVLYDRNSPDYEQGNYDSDKDDSWEAYYN